ncbi:hypothetical protein SAMN05892883_3393 [Jatrophihabitans sp. GAS493]|nr:hypothetical protein SAMN05892883_3393 [Jatrophihabitans sp. GAS493]
MTTTSDNRITLGFNRGLWIYIEGGDISRWVRTGVLRAELQAVRMLAVRQSVVRVLAVRVLVVRVQLVRVQLARARDSQPPPIPRLLRCLATSVS